MLNLITNVSASAAQRNLNTTNMSLKKSLEKLSSGYRVNRASDDVAAMAIGSRLNSELTALKTVSVNTGQAISMLQIAEGTMARVQDMLVRMKSLSAQAANGTLSNTERSLLDVEFQAIMNEVERVADDTSFNGTKLVNTDQTFTYDAVNGTAGNAARVVLRKVGVLNADAGGAARNIAVTASGSDRILTLIVGDAAGGGAVTYSGTVLSRDINANAIDSADNSGQVHVELTITAGASSAHDKNSKIIVTLNDGANVTAAASHAVTVTVTGAGYVQKDFRVGTGSNSAEDVITAKIASVSKANLGLTATIANSTEDTLDITTVANADIASTRVDSALETVILARASAGALQNRIEAAAVNLATTIENTESAKSSYLDADIASEITEFTAKQILLQSGISTLAQANQVPRNLLALFRQ